jgi:hypothetical protein
LAAILRGKKSRIGSEATAEGVDRYAIVDLTPASTRLKFSRRRGTHRLRRRKG